MKKITFIIVLMTSSFGFSQTLEGTWKISPEAGALSVGPSQGSAQWWSNNVGDLSTRACFFDDTYVFDANGTFSNILGSSTWLEVWQGVAADVCGTPVAPHNGSNAATYSVNTIDNTVTITGVGAYLGLPKAYNLGELTNPSAAPASITYKITSITSALLTLDILVGGGNWWRFKLTKQGVAPSCTDGIQNGTETGIDCGGSCPNVCLLQINLPVTFEGTSTDYTMTDFGGNVSTKVVDPTDSSNTVMKVVKTAGAQGWAGTTMGAGSLGFSSAVPFTPTNKKMYVRVWTPASGIKVRLKVEDHAIDTHYVEQDVITTMQGWESLMFDFTTPATAPYDSTFIYDKASIFFNFIPDVPNAVEATYYFDNVSYGAALGVSSFETSNIKMYPNPTSSVFTIEANEVVESVSLFNVLGQEVLAKNPNSNSVTFDISNLQTGVYIVKTMIGGVSSTSRIVKK
jgi:hypothetical protein